MPYVHDPNMPYRLAVFLYTLLGLLATKGTCMNPAELQDSPHKLPTDSLGVSKSCYLT